MTSSSSSTPPAKRRFRITANQITILRILALPFPCWALIERPQQPWMWIAFVWGTLVGATDFVDGWLARRDGPTVLGSLLDPVADKLFVAVLFLPVVAHRECPAWAAGMLFVRELLITALRTSLLVRKQSLKTSSLGKLKTVVQMGGIAAFYLTLFVPRPEMPWVHAGCTVVMCLYGVFWTYRRRAVPPLWLVGGALLWGGVSAAAHFLEPMEVAYLIFMATVLLTWVSGADYLWGAGKVFLQQGLSIRDVTRVVWSIAHGLALIPLLDDVPAMTVPVVLSLSAELAYGGIDNGVAAERGRFAKGSVLPTTAIAIAVGAVAWGKLVDEPTLLWLAWALALASIANFAIAFVRERDVFMSPDRPLAG